MAQAVFDEHPLEEYLRGAGESPQILPGNSLELEREMDPYHDLFNSAWDEETSSNWCPQILLDFIQLLQSAVSSVHTSNTSDPFIERFKYTVISSSLLAPSLPTPHPGRPPRSSIPGRLSHSRGSSTDLDHSITPPPLTSHPDPSYAPISFAAASAAMFFSIGHSFLFLLSALATLLLYFNLNSMTEMSKHDMTSSFNALDDLIAVNKAWECVVQDAASHLDNEDRSIPNGSSNPSIPSPIRVALHSCLQTTHTQCDNIRHLFSALTLPTELSQLSEMYAPPSPIKSGFTPETSTQPSPCLSPPPPHQPTTPENKRATWNGSYASLAYAGSPTNTISRRRDKHRTHLSDVFRDATSSAPTTPLPRNPGPSLPDVAEDHDKEEPGTSSASAFSPLQSSFGSAALDLQRDRKSDGMEAFQTPPSNYFTTDLRTPRSPRSNLFFSTISGSSKFTSVQPARHPLSYTSLIHSLQGAVAAKRYACSHLLALRFGDEEDEGYWEDVRSVMGLLASALADSCSRLSEALDEAEHQNLQDQHPTPETSQSTISENDIPGVVLQGPDSYKRRKVDSRISFAPMPSHVSRFAAHIAAISSALDDAREHLDQCVSSLKSDPIPSSSSTSSQSMRHSRSLSKILLPHPGEEPEVELPRALQAYERLRRELGLALRECERGKERLLEIVNPPPIPSDEEDFDDLPGLGHDASDDSDKPDPNSPSEDEADAAALTSNTGRFPTAVVNAEGGEGEGNILDDATSHLLLTTSTRHLPLPGIEEVFEADTGAKVAFSRERSKMSREERIKLAKARRESGQGLAIGPGDADVGLELGVGIEKWGPGGEVVQELKDVIWKVGERRRKMADSPAQIQDDAVHLPSSTLASATLESP